VGRWAEMVVRSVVRRSKLRELGMSRASFRAAGELGPVGATVQIPRDKKIKVTVTIENTGSQSVTGKFGFMCHYADTLSDSSGDPQQDWFTWWGEGDVYDSKPMDEETTLDPGSTLTMEGEYPAEASTWSEGTIIDAGIIVSMKVDDTVIHLDSLKITDAVEIIAPTLRVEITDVTFSETE